MVRYVLNKCKVSVSENQRIKESPGLRECLNLKAWRKHEYDGILRRPGG